MNRPGKSVFLFLFVLMISCAGEEYYATPEKTLHRYMQNKTCGSAVEIEATLNCFTQKDRDWWNNHYATICASKFGTFSPACGGVTQQQSNVFTDVIAPLGPSSEVVDSSDVDEKGGTATLVIGGKEFHFKKESGNWKLDGFFGIEQDFGG